MLWTGGKDSCLALCRSIDSGIKVTCLATFVPASGSDFLAHPKHLILKQAEAMKLQHAMLPIAQPYEESYEVVLKLLADKYEAEGVITGDIDLVSGHSNWISERCNPLGLEVIRPLWKNQRDLLIKEILSRRIQAKITWINHPKIPRSFKGRLLDEKLLEELEELAGRNDIDLCGENGEYHTMVTRAPIFGDFTLVI